MGYKLLSAHDVGQDRLEVALKVDGEDEPRLAFGWVSAVENHFDEDSIATEDVLVDDPTHPDGKAHRELAGQRRSDAEPRTMTADELKAYCHRLIQEQHPDLAKPPERRQLL